MSKKRIPYHPAVREFRKANAELGISRCMKCLSFCLEEDMAKRRGYMCKACAAKAVLEYRIKRRQAIKTVKLMGIDIPVDDSELGTHVDRTDARFAIKGRKALIFLEELKQGSNA